MQTKSSAFLFNAWIPEKIKILEKLQTNLLFVKNQSGGLLLDAAVVLF